MNAREVNGEEELREPLYKYFTRKKISTSTEREIYSFIHVLLLFDVFLVYH